MSVNIFLGCAGFYKEGYINVDWNPIVKTDLCHDLNSFPYPIDTSSADSIEAYHIIEHLDNPFKVMEELHRILKPGGVLHLKVPHCTRGFTHSEHKRGFDVSFPLYFSKKFEQSGYFGIEFDSVLIKLNWLGNIHLLKHIGVKKSQLSILLIINRVISKLANINPYFCSRIWCFWVGGFDEIEFIFKCVKKV